MLLSKGRILKQESKRQIAVRSLPLPFGLAEKLHQMIWRAQELTNDQAPNQFSLLVGSASSGKTNLTKLWIDQCFEQEMGFWEMDAAGMLTDYTIRKAVEVGWPVEKFAVIDFFPDRNLGYPVIDFLEDDPDDDLSPYRNTSKVTLCL
jgi:hypothetical protein